MTLSEYERSINGDKMRAISKDLRSYHIAENGIESVFKSAAIVGSYEPNSLNQ